MTTHSPHNAEASALIIDDDVALLDSWTRLARVDGFDVVTADTWDEGLALFHVLSPDLVIADYNLPGSSHGFRLLAAIRRLRPSVRLVLISGVIEPSRLKDVEETGVVDRALSKGDTTTLTCTVLEEIKLTAERSRTPTNWHEFAEAFLHAELVNSADIDWIDHLLTTSVGNSND